MRRFRYPTGLATRHSTPAAQQPLAFCPPRETKSASDRPSKGSRRIPYSWLWRHLGFVPDRRRCFTLHATEAQTGAAPWVPGAGQLWPQGRHLSHFCAQWGNRGHPTWLPPPRRPPRILTGLTGSGFPSPTTGSATPKRLSVPLPPLDVDAGSSAISPRAEFSPGTPLIART